MSKLSDTHNIQLTNLEILVLEYILEDLDVDLELNFTDGKKISYSDIIDGFVQKLKVAENEP
nr:MAG TPA: hypothetical protein [Bacteriophage sp.]